VLSRIKLKKIRQSKFLSLDWRRQLRDYPVHDESVEWKPGVEHLPNQRISLCLLCRWTDLES